MHTNSEYEDMKRICIQAVIEYEYRSSKKDMESMHTRSEYEYSKSKSGYGKSPYY